MAQQRSPWPRERRVFSVTSETSRTSNDLQCNRSLACVPAIGAVQRRDQRSNRDDSTSGIVLSVKQNMQHGSDARDEIRGPKRWAVESPGEIDAELNGCRDRGDIDAPK